MKTYPCRILCVLLLVLLPMSCIAEQPQTTPSPTPYTLEELLYILSVSEQVLVESSAAIDALNQELELLSAENNMNKQVLESLNADLDTAKANKEAADQYLASIDNSIQMALNALNGITPAPTPTPTPAPTPNYPRLANDFIYMLHDAFNNLNGMKMYKLETLLNMYADELSTSGYVITKQSKKQYQITFDHLELVLFSDDSEHCTTVGMYTTDQTLEHEVTKLAIWEDKIDFITLDSGEMLFYITGI